jgi:hypothetical protein
VSNAELFYETQFYGNSLWKSRCIGVVDSVTVRNSPGQLGNWYFATRSLDNLLQWTQKGWIEYPIEDFSAFVSHHRDFLLWGDGWIPSLLVRDGAKLEWIGQANSIPLFHVNMH